MKENDNAVICLTDSRPSVAVFDDIISMNFVDELITEYNDNIQHAIFDGAYSNDIGRHKLYNSKFATCVSNELLTNDHLIYSLRHYEDYSYRSFFNGFANKFEVSLVRYEQGSAYNWHVDHPPIPSLIRVLNYTIFLTDHCGGNVEFTTIPMSNKFVEDHGWEALKAQAYIEPKIARLIIYPSWIVHRVTKTTKTRDVLLGHICIGN